jgi:hypothetical protein
MTLTWTKQTISIAFDDGMQEREGTVAEGTGLGYYWTYETIGYEATLDVIGITHLASGRCIPVPTVKTEGIAKKWIEELAAMPLDWTLPMDELIASPNYGEIPVKCRKLAAMIAVSA